MRFYTKEHKYYCGIDLHARTIYVCIVDQTGQTFVHRNLETSGEVTLNVIAPRGNSHMVTTISQPI